MSETRKVGKIVVSFRTRRGVLVYRLAKKIGRKLHLAEGFTLRVVRNGKQYYFPLPSKQRDAENEANKIDAYLDVRSHSIESAVKLFNPDGWERKNPTSRCATVGDILTAHEGAEKAMGIEPSTADGYRQHLLILFRQGLARRRGGTEPTDDAVKKMGLEELTLRLANDFKAARVSLAGENKSEQETKKRSANQVLRSVSAIFSFDARQHYTHLKLPAELDDTLKRMFFRKVGKVKKRLPPVNVIRRVYGDAHELRDGDGKKIAPDRNAYLAWLLAAHAGFRKKEVANAMRDWIDRGEKPRIWVRGTAEFKIKDKEERIVEVQSWVLDEIEALSESPALILSGTKSERKVHTFDRLNAWLRRKGFAEKKGDKGVHGLRFLFGSYRANRFSLYDAQKMLGHESADTTNDHYADVMLDKTLYALWENRPSWAVPEKPKPGQIAVVDV